MQAIKEQENQPERGANQDKARHGIHENFPAFQRLKRRGAAFEYPHAAFQQDIRDNRQDEQHVRQLRCGGDGNRDGREAEPPVRRGEQPAQQRERRGEDFERERAARKAIPQIRRFAALFALVEPQKQPGHDAEHVEGLRRQPKGVNHAGAEQEERHGDEQRRQRRVELPQIEPAENDHQKQQQHVQREKAVEAEREQKRREQERIDERFRIINVVVDFPQKDALRPGAPALLIHAPEVFRRVFEVEVMPETLRHHVIDGLVAE